MTTLPAPATAWAEATARVRSERLRARRRQLLVCGALILVAVVALAIALTVGRASLSVGEVVNTLLGGGDRNSRYIVLERRLPRALTGILVGAALGVAGALLQTLLRNPLASPDVIGITTGSSAAAVFLLTVVGTTGAMVSLGALVGGVVTATLMYLLAWRDGVSGYRLVLIGIGLAAILASAVSYMMSRAQVTTAHDALVWLTGSLNGRGWGDLAPLAVAMVILLPACAVLAGPLGALRCGDDLARGLGVRVEPARVGLLLCAVGLAAVATAAAGPVAFIALLAAPIARRLMRDGSPALMGAALVGAVLITAADIAAQNISETNQLPVGVLTGAIGAPYLLWLLVQMNRAGRGG